MKVEIELIGVETNKKKGKENKLKKFKLKNRCVELITMEVRLVMGGIDNCIGGQ